MGGSFSMLSARAVRGPWWLADSVLLNGQGPCVGGRRRRWGELDPHPHTSRPLPRLD